MQNHFIFFSLLILFSALSNALPDDAAQDLLLESESLEYDQIAGTITYSGNVIMQQGSMRITADKVIIQGNSTQANQVNAHGSPALFQQTPSIGAEPVKAQANELVYQVEDKSLLLQGNAYLNQEGSSLSGNRIEYDVTKAIVKASSDTSKGKTEQRVRMVIPPKALDSKAQ